MDTILANRQAHHSITLLTFPWLSNPSPSGPHPPLLLGPIRCFINHSAGKWKWTWDLVSLLCKQWRSVFYTYPFPYFGTPYAVKYCPCDGQHTWLLHCYVSPRKLDLSRWGRQINTHSRHSRHSRCDEKTSCQFDGMMELWKNGSHNDSELDSISVNSHACVDPARLISSDDRRPSEQTKWVGAPSKIKGRTTQVCKALFLSILKVGLFPPPQKQKNQQHGRQFKEWLYHSFNTIYLNRGFFRTGVCESVIFWNVIVVKRERACCRVFYGGKELFRGLHYRFIAAGGSSWGRHITQPFNGEGEETDQLQQTFDTRCQDSGRSNTVYRDLTYTPITPIRIPPNTTPYNPTHLISRHPKHEDLLYLLFSERGEALLYHFLRENHGMRRVSRGRRDRVVRDDSIHINILRSVNLNML